MYHTNEVKSVDLLGNDSFMNEEKISKMFIAFVKEYKTTYATYAHQLHANITQQKYHMVLQMEHMNQYSPELYNLLTTRPTVIETLEKAICAEYSVPYFQLQIISHSQVTKIRNINASKNNKIIRIQGIVVSCSTVVTKPKELFITCRNCLSSKRVKDVIPRNCDNTECPIDPYIILPEKSVVEDTQYVKIQEFFDDIPVGETPRHFSVVLTNGLVDAICPGNSVQITGVFSIKNQNEKSFSYLKALGVEHEKNKLQRSFSAEEEAEFMQMSRDGIYERFSKSIAPGILGMADIKKALACMLFGGTRRLRDDGIALRGDINVLLMGDPGIAKSQLLKFVESVSPISVYTSGKGSSAAGLTASVIKDRHNEFYLEGGALVLADGGVCCIDEFDKMNYNDQVSIHEAMEQQTISIAKAGITTVLNTRTAILAAANPAFGRYDDFKTPEANIEMASTILSRFDCIFIIRDVAGENDRIIAEHVLRLHTRSKAAGSNANVNGSSNVNANVNDSSNVNDSMEEEPAKANEFLSVDKMRRYIQYAKAKVAPVISNGAAAKLSGFYVQIRQEVAEADGAKKGIPITVRQLEAIVRIGEALAKMELSSIVTEKHMDEAIRIFQVSTMSAVAQGHMVEGMVRPAFFEEIEDIVAKIKDIMPVGSSKKYSDLYAVIKKNDGLIRKAVDYMVKQNKLVSKDYGRILVRLP
ncbi:DNA replication licensing factor MCM5 [Enteropsectra breve]|nr:DNA replication licensing factor MCM5 [Enteropsectra breve]